MITASPIQKRYPVQAPKPTIKPIQKLNVPLPKVKKQAFDLSDVRLNKSGTVGTEPIGKPDGKGGMTMGTDIKAGKLGSVFVPNDIVKRYTDKAVKVGKGLAKTAVTLASAAGAIATEPFTGRILKQLDQNSDADIARQEEINRQRKADMVARYSLPATKTN